MAEVKRKRVTLHPLRKDGQMDTTVNLYPKCFVDGIVDRQGNTVNVVTTDSATPVNLDEIIDNIEQQISEIPTGDVTTAQLNQALADKQNIIEDLDDIRTGAAAGAAAVSQEDFNNAMGDVEDRFNELHDVVVPYCYLSFEYDYEQERPILIDCTESLLTSGLDQSILLSVNGNLAEIWHISSWTSHNRINIELYNDISYIEMHGDVDAEPDQ